MIRYLALFLLCIAPLYASPAIVTLYGPINQASAAKLISGIQDANRDTKLHDPIILYMNSPGGDLGAGASIIGAMQASRRPVWTVNVGFVASMGALVYAYGEKRFMLPYSSLLYHDGYTESSGSPQQIQTQSAAAIKLSGEFEKHVAKLAGISMNEYRLRAAALWIIFADEAVKAHLADKIVNPVDYPAPMPEEKHG